MTHRHRRYLAPITLALALLSACAADREPLHVAVVGSWGRGEQNRGLIRGAVLAAEVANTEGGIQGRALVIDIFNDGYVQGYLDRPAAVAEEIVGRPEIVGVVGNTNSDPLAAAAPVYGDRIPVLVPMDVHSAADSSRTLFGLIDEGAVQQALAEDARDQQWRRVVVLLENSTGARYAAGQFEEHFDGEIVSFNPFYIMPAEGFAPFVEYSRMVGADAIIGFTSAYSALQLVRALEGTWQGGIAGGHPWLPLLDHPEAVRPIRTAVPFQLDAADPDAATFLRRFREAYGTDPDPQAILAYDAVSAIVAVGRRTPLTRQSLARGLRESPTPYRGISGPMHFDGNGRRLGMTARVVLENRLVP